MGSGSSVMVSTAIADASEAALASAIESLSAESRSRVTAAVAACNPVGSESFHLERLQTLNVVDMAGTIRLSTDLISCQTVQDVRLAAEKSNPGKNVQDILWGSKKLQDCQPLCEIGITAPATLHVVFGGFSAKFANNWYNPVGIDGDDSVTVRPDCNYEIFEKARVATKEKLKASCPETGEVGDIEELEASAVLGKLSRYSAALEKDKVKADRLRSLITDAGTALCWSWTTDKGNVDSCSRWGTKLLVVEHEVSLDSSYDDLS